MKRYVAFTFIFVARCLPQVSWADSTRTSAPDTIFSSPSRNDRTPRPRGGIGGGIEEMESLSNRKSDGPGKDERNEGSGSSARLFGVFDSPEQVMGHFSLGDRLGVSPGDSSGSRGYELSDLGVDIITSEDKAADEKLFGTVENAGTGGRVKGRRRPSKRIDDIRMLDGDNSDLLFGGKGEGRDYGEGSEKGELYDAYNMLHTLAQDFRKPFDAPAVVVVGHQSSGKSALLEALMGFQFNQVGGGTKTRRPVALRMQYNPKCHQPKCYLQGDDGVERPKSLSKIQEYIESENRRLERDPVRCFDSREINIRMEYKYCPNMILIDTPGLISAPRTARGHTGNVQQRALQASAREAERLVVTKMRCPDYIILCVEDTADWKHGSTREIVQKADPDLSRTVIVQTKLDTKIPQFGNPTDVEEFLRADIIDGLSPRKLGGPFFTSIPSGRVGRERFDNDEYFFDNDDDFVAACAETEDSVRAIVLQRLKNRPPSTIQGLLPRVGLSRLRAFLERRVDECYRRNVAKIVPLLKAEHVNCAKRLAACEKELDALSVERLKEGADKFCDEFCAALKDAIQGSIVAPPSIFGETMHQETLAAGSFNEVQNSPLAVSSRTWDRLVSGEVGNFGHRLYGGAQYHRCLREFSLATRCLRLPVITEDEIANAAGIGDTHDGVNFLRASCVIALEKARISFDPLLDALRLRCMHIMGRLCSVSEFMIQQKEERAHCNVGYSSAPDLIRNSEVPNTATDITHNPMFRQLVRTIFEKFVQKCSDSVMTRCRDDLTALTRFVTWDLHERSGGALRRSLPDQTDIVTVYQVAVKAASEGSRDYSKQAKRVQSTKNAGDNNVKEGALSTTRSSVLAQTEDDRSERDYHNLLQLMEEAACSRNANRTNLVIGGLVQHIVSQWREAFCKSVTMKFNCFFMLPFVDEFQQYFRRELQRVYDGDLCEVFDLVAARRQLNQLRDDLSNECSANKKLQEKFDSLLNMMKKQQEASSTDNGLDGISSLGVRSGRKAGQ